MKTIHKGTRLSVVLFPVQNPALGAVFGYQGAGYRYLWTIDIAVWRWELSVRWWNPKAARFRSSV